MALKEAPNLVLEFEKVSKQELTLKKELALMKRALKLTNSVNSNKRINYLVLAQIINSVPSGVKIPPSLQNIFKELFFFFKIQT